MDIDELNNLVITLKRENEEELTDSVSLNAVSGILVIQDSMPNATLKVTKISTGQQVYNGAVTPQTIATGAGSFEISITQFDKTITDQISISGDSVLNLDDYSVNISLAEKMTTYSDSGLTVGGQTVAAPFRCIKNAGTLEVVATSSLIWTTGRPVTVRTNITVAEANVTVNAPTYSDPFTITSGSNRAMTLPKVGAYALTICGGGGGGGGGGVAARSEKGVLGGDGGNGGKGGRVVGTSTTVTSTAYTVTIGAGGDGGNGGISSTTFRGSTGYAGGTTSVSGAVSLSAGGGQGGEGGTGYTSATSLLAGGMGGDGGDGSNEVSMKIRGTSIAYGRGGNGGRGGRYESINDSSSPNSGSAGTVTTMPDGFSIFANSGNGGDGGRGGSASSGYANGGYGGQGGNGLVISRARYGIGGNGGNGGGGAPHADSGGGYIIVSGYKGSAGTSGVVCWELVL